MATEADFAHLMGWKDEPALVEKVVAMLPHRSFSEAAPHLKDTGVNQDVLFWEIEEVLFGSVQVDWWLLAQAIGDCVAHGYAAMCTDTILIDWFTGGLSSFPGFVASEPIYGGSRCQIGGWWNDYGDGSIGAYAARWVKEYGVIPRGKYGNIDLTTYSGNTAKQMGGKGCPKELEAVAKIHPISAVTPVKSYEDVRDATCNLKASGPASNVGYTMKRDPGGWCRRSGNWNHQMKFRGHCVVKGNKPAVVQANNWGDYLGSSNNKVMLESGREVTLPPGHFLITPEDCTTQVRQGDSFALAGVTRWQAAKFPGVFK